MAHALVVLQTHLECGVEPILDQRAEKVHGERRVVLHGVVELGLATSSVVGPLELVAHVDRQRRVVVEVEVLELVVTEDHENVGAHLFELGVHHVEPSADTRGLGDSLLFGLDRHIRTVRRTALTDVLPLFRSQVRKRTVGHVEHTNKLCHLRLPHLQRTDRPAHRVEQLPPLSIFQATHL